MRLFQECGWRVVAGTSNDKDADRLRQMGVIVSRIDFNRRGLTPKQDLIALLKLGCLYLRYRPKLINHFHAKPTLFGNIAAWLLPRARIVNTVTGLGNVLGSRRFMRFLVALGYRFSLKRSDITVFQNPDDRQLFVQKGWVREERTRVILSSGVDLQRFKTRKSTVSSSPCILMVARLLWPKGVGEFVKAAEICKRSVPNARFQLAGEFDPAHPDAVDKAWVDKQVKAGTIEFLGYLANMEDRLPDVYVFVLPSYYREGVPRVLLEASACGVPVITADVPGCREALIPGQSGILVGPRNAQALADAIMKLLADPALRNKMGESARTFMERQFDITTVAKEYTAIYRSLGIPIEF